MEENAGKQATENSLDDDDDALHGALWGDPHVLFHVLLHCLLRTKTDQSSSFFCLSYCPSNLPQMNKSIVNSYAGKQKTFYEIRSFRFVKRRPTVKRGEMGI